MTITENPFTGAQLYLRDSQWAHKFFGGITQANQPKQKFLFVAGFKANTDALLAAGMPIELDRQLRQDNVFLVKAFDPPKFDFDVEILDQYNKKRVVQKRVNYAPVSIRFHDDVDNKIYNLAEKYYKYYFRDADNTEDVNWQLDTVSSFINQGNWGYRAQVYKYFFRSMYIAWANSGRVSYMTLHNPLITNITYDTLDYSEVGTPLEISMALEYEGVVFNEINKNITDQSQLVTTVRELLSNAEEIGQPFKGPDPHQAVPGKDRSPGLGELVNAGLTFYGKYNGKPTVEDAMNDFFIAPAKGQLSGGLNSWGNFNFGGIGTAKSQAGAFGGPGSDVFKYVNSGGQVTSNFNSTKVSNLSDERSNAQFLKSTGLDSKIG